MGLNPGDKTGVRNALGVIGIFVMLKGIKKLSRKAKRKEGQGTAVNPYEEALCTALAAALCGSLKGRVGALHEGLGGVASLLPIRLLAYDNTYHFNYRFMVAYIVAQVMVANLPRRVPIPAMMLSASQLLTAWVLWDTLPQDYIHFLHSQGKISRSGLLEVRRRFREETNGSIVELAFPRPRDQPSYVQTHGTDYKGFHKAALEYFVNHFKEANSFYLKIYLLRALAMALKTAGAKGMASMLSIEPSPKLSLKLLSFAFDIARSSLFLSLYCTSAWYMIGITGKLLPDHKPRGEVLWLTLMVPGLALLVESAQQKVTISDYCATFALYPLLSTVPGLFDAAGVVTTYLCATGAVKQPGLLRLMWGGSPPAAAPTTAKAPM